MPFSILPDTVLAAFGLVLTRTSALMLSVPILGSRSGFSGYKIALIALLSVVLYLVSGARLDPVPDAFGLSLLALREVMIGLFLGFFLTLSMLTVRVAGELIGHEMGFMIARQVDPATGLSTPLITSVYETLFILGFLAMNGHHVIVRALGSSFERAPVGSLDLGQGIVPAMVEMFGEMFQAGIVFAAPVLVFLALISVLIGLLARVVPQLNVLELGFSIRVSVALCALFLFAPLLEPAIDSILRRFVSWTEKGLTLLGA